MDDKYFEDKYFEDLLIELDKEDIQIPANLVENTLKRINNLKLLPLVCTTILLNMVTLMVLIIIVYLKFNFRGAIIFYGLWSFTSIISTLPILLLKEKFKLKFLNTI